MAQQCIDGLSGKVTLSGCAEPLVVKMAEKRVGIPCKLFISKIGDTVTDEEIRKLFEGYGSVLDVALIRNSLKKFGFVHMENVESGEAAMNGLNGRYTVPGSAEPLVVKFADSDGGGRKGNFFLLLLLVLLSSWSLSLVVVLQCFRSSSWENSHGWGVVGRMDAVVDLCWIACPVRKKKIPFFFLPLFSMK